MFKCIIAGVLLTSITVCKKSPKSDNEKEVQKPSFSMDISKPYTLVDPIPENDEWLASFKKNHKYGIITNPAVKGLWETWVWRKTSIDLGKGITVYARSENDVQFLI